MFFFFYLPLSIQLYPSVANSCGNGACSISDNACLCSVSLSETHVFDSLPSRAEVLSRLKLGAFDPATFAGSDTAYDPAGSADGVEAFVSSGSGIGSKETIFKVTDEYGKAGFFKNMVSAISLGGVYEVRNPPTFINLVKPELRDVEYEGMQWLLARMVAIITFLSSLILCLISLCPFSRCIPDSPGPLSEHCTFHLQEACAVSWNLQSIAGLCSKGSRSIYQWIIYERRSHLRKQQIRRFESRDRGHHPRSRIVESRSR